jgi:hypothetical protein
MKKMLFLTALLLLPSVASAQVTCKADTLRLAQLPSRSRADSVLLKQSNAQSRVINLLCAATTKPETTTAPAPVPTPAPDTTPAPTPAPSTEVDKVMRVIGPVVSESMSRTFGAPWVKYWDDWSKWNETRWKNEGSVWDAAYYYDRGKAYYVKWVQTGNAVYRQRADLLVLAYRRDYVEKNSYGSSAHWTFPAGLEIHYNITGDTLSKRAICGVATNLDSERERRNLSNVNHEYMENRIQARVLHADLTAYRVGCTYRHADGRTWMVTDGPAKLRDALTQIVSTQRADGSWAWGGYCGMQLNYMVGILADVLIEYHRDFEKDPRILSTVKKAYDYLWNTQWDAVGQAFNYTNQAKGAVCAANSTSTFTAGDLNGFFVNGFWWLYKQTGDGVYRTRADAVFAGLVNNDAISGGVHLAGSKQFNQQYAITYGGTEQR